MASTFTQNLGIEQPATGEQANVWGVTVNRNFATYDLAIKGNTSMTVSTSPVPLNIDNGATLPQAANTVIVWTGPQSGTPPGVVDIQPYTRQSLYIMRNQTNGSIQFQQGNASDSFVLNAGYDAIIYSDGNGTGAATAQALASPQFDNVLITGNMQIQGSVTTTLSVPYLSVSGWIALGNPAMVPDAFTIFGMGTYGQIRMVPGINTNYGVIIRNDGVAFHILATNQADPYGSWATNAQGQPLYGFAMDLSTRTFGMGGWMPDGTHSLNLPSIHASSIAVDGNVATGGGLNVGGGRAYFNHNEPYQVGLVYEDTSANWTFYIGVTVNNQFQVSWQDGSWLFLVDRYGNVSIPNTGSLTVNGQTNVAGLGVTGGITAGGWIHTTAGGFQFPDGTTQTTAATTAPMPPAYTIAPHNVGRNGNTPYGNPSGTNLMWVNAAVDVGAQAFVSASAGAGPTILVGYYTPSGSNYGSFCFPVPVGFQYQINLLGSWAGYPINYVVEWY